MKEIVTLQVGSFANFVGSHFWNFQDELLGLAGDPNGDSIFKASGLDMDVLYRLSETAQGKYMYCPRLLAIDARGSLGTVRAAGSFCDETSSDTSLSTWNGTVARYISEPCEKNDFLCSLDDEYSHKSSSASSDDPQKRRQLDKALVDSLENGVQFWTDYLKAQLHPSSLYEIEGLWKDVTPFDDYGCGRGIINKSSQLEELSNRLHFFVEECDHMQGFQILVDDAGGFAAITTEILEILADEYDHSPVIMYTFRDPYSFVKYQDTNAMTRRLHDAISFVKLSDFPGLLVPTGLSSLANGEACRYLLIDDQKLFHSSSIYAASFHASSLPLRLESERPSATTGVGLGGMDMNTLIRSLSYQSEHQIPAILDVAMPAPSIKGSQYKGLLDKRFHPLTPDALKDSVDSEVSELLVILGALLENKGKGVQASVFEVQDALDCIQGQARLSNYHLSVSKCPLPIPLPFPRIFGNSIGDHGQIIGSPSSCPRCPASHDVFSIPMATRLRTSKAIHPFLKKRKQDLSNLGLVRGSPGSHVLEEWGLEKTEVQELAETLADMVHALDMQSDNDSYSE